MAKQQKTAVMWLIIGFLLGFLVAWGAFSGEKEEEVTLSDVPEIIENDASDEIETDKPKTQPTLVAEDNLIHVKDQESGSEVFVSRIELTQEAWVAVRELSDGELGNILGAKRFDIGVHQGTVNLLRDTTAENNYSVVLYAENGDGEFDFENTDPLLTNKLGQPISMLFEAY